MHATARELLTVQNLVNSLTVSLHNRPRHRRSLLSSSVTWAELADDARAYTRATQYFPAAVATALEVLRLDALLEGSLVGWELDLIDRAEEREAWWWVSTVAERRGKLAAQLESTDWRTVFASALAQVADGMLNVRFSRSLVFPRTEAISCSLSIPFRADQGYQQGYNVERFRCATSVRQDDLCNRLVRSCTISGCTPCMMSGARCEIRWTRARCAIHVEYELH